MWSGKLDINQAKDMPTAAQPKIEWSIFTLHTVTERLTYV